MDDDNSARKVINGDYCGFEVRYLQNCEAAGQGMPKIGAANRKQSVENSKELNERLSVVGALAENYRLVSFDAKTLFSSAPVKEAIFSI